MSVDKKDKASPDIVFDILHAQKDAAFPPGHRERHGASETMFVTVESLGAVKDILETALTLREGVKALAVERTLSLRLLKDGSDLPPALRQQLNDAASKGLIQQPAALRIVEENFAPLNAMTLVNLAAVIEVAVEQAAMSVLRFHPGAVRKLRELGVKTTSTPEGRDLTYEEARPVYARLKEWAFGSKSKAPGALLLQLSAIGLTISLTEQVQSDIREMIYVRNCILHRRSRADKNADRDAPGLGLVDGQRFIVKPEQMMRYAGAAMDLTSAIATASLSKNLRQ